MEIFRLSWKCSACVEDAIEAYVVFTVTGWRWFTSIHVFELTLCSCAHQSSILLTMLHNMLVSSLTILVTLNACTLHEAYMMLHNTLSACQHAYVTLLNPLVMLQIKSCFISSHDTSQHTYVMLHDAPTSCFTTLLWRFATCQHHNTFMSRFQHVYVTLHNTVMLTMHIHNA